MDRFLKYINIALTALAAAVLGLAYWFVWRPLPATSGEIRVPVEKPVTVGFDSLGVPRIEAQSMDDVLFAQGFITAQERLWQMETLRRHSAGELSEIVGKAALDLDIESRRLQLRHVAEAAAAQLPPEEKRLFAAYVRGVNAFILANGNRMPLEFTLLRIQPRLWRISDSILVALAMIRNLTTTWKDEIQKRTLLAGGDPVKVNALFPPRTGDEEQPGSNVWAVAGKLTASGKPILANDMHLEWSIPGTWYMAHLRAPGLKVSGVTLPGVPGVIVGHNERIAWGITNLHFDVQDLYAEQIDERTGRFRAVARHHARIAWGITNLHFDVQDLYAEQIDERTGRYRTGARMEQAGLRREVILVKGDKPVEVGVWITRHGPILRNEQGQPMAVRWVAAEATAFRFPILDINRSANWTQFCASLARFYAPGSNFAYADVDGNIGYHAAGRLPIRAGWRGDVPVDGASGEFEWKGYVPFENLPQAFNPASGLIVSANQDPFPESFEAPVNGNFSSHYRSTQIRRRLESKKGWRPADMIGIQADVFSAFDLAVARAVVEVTERRRSSAQPVIAAAALLKNWNGQMDRDLPQPFIAVLTFQHLRRVIGEAASPKGAAYDFPMAQAVIAHLIAERPAGWFTDWDSTLLRAFSDAVEEGMRMQGGDPAKWRYGAFNEITIAHPVGGQLGFLRRFFNIGPLPMSGGSTTVKQTTRRLGPSMRFVADLGNWDNSLLNLPAGQSGHVLSTHYKDQWDHYLNGVSYPMPFSRAAVKDTLTLSPLP